MSLKAWFQAARPLALGNIAPPLVLGQALAYRNHGVFEWRWFGLALAFGALDQLYIVFANDYADADADVNNDTFTIFSGGSRVIPEGKLPRPALGRAAVAAALGLLLLSVTAALVADRWLLLPAWVLAVVLLWAYSYRPFRLSYRGHGELLQALGLGVVLPGVGYHAQVGGIELPALLELLPPLLLGYAGNIVTALPDYPSDDRAGKRTYPVRLGQKPARVVALTIVAAAVLATPLVVGPKLGGYVVASVGFVLLAVALVPFPRASAEQRAACLSFVVLLGGCISLMHLGWSWVLFSG